MAAALAAPAVGAGTGGGPDQQGPFERHLERGLAKLAAGDPEAAVADLEVAVDLEPGDARARFHLGRALVEAGRPAEAIDHLRAALERAEAAGPVHLMLAQAFLALDRLDAAEAHLAAAETGGAGHPFLLYYRAMLAYRRGEVSEAIALLDRAAAAEPGWIEPPLRAGELALEAGDTDGAVQRLRAATGRDPGDARAWLALADVLASRRPWEALQAYRQAVQRAPDRLEYRLALAAHLEGLKRFAAAEEAYSEVLRRAPQHALARFRRARLLQRRGDLEAALAEVEQAFRDGMEAAVELPRPPTELLSTLAQIRYTRAEILSKLGREEEAIEEARQVVAVSGEFPEAHYLLGTLLLRHGDPEAGRSLLIRFRQLNESREHRGRGDYYLHEVRDPDRAAAAYRQAVSVRPDDAGAWLGLAGALRRLGRAAEALDALGEARRHGAEDEAWYRERVLALWSAGRRQEARAAWQEARRLGYSLGPEVWRLVRGRQPTGPGAETVSRGRAPL